MKRSYRLLMHDSFTQQMFEAIGDDEKLLKQVQTSLRKIEANPAAERPLTAISSPALQGKLRRIWVGGRRGRRLIYLFISGKDIVMPIFLSPADRSQFNYDDYDWEGFAKKIINDLRKNNINKFTQLG